MDVQYVTNEQGQKTGVLLNIDTYQQLIGSQSIDTDLLIGLSRAELEALATSQLALTAQARLDELLAQQKGGTLSNEDLAELDQLLSQVDQLTILKTRARYTLAQSTAAP